MGTLWESDSTIIDRVRIKTRGGDPEQARQKIGRLLGNADLRPSRLPISSILCLRKLRDPAPEVRWEHERVRPPLAWEQSVTRELDRLTAAAVRPALAPVPPTAQAVLFLDRAELLACLTADWLQGTVNLNWWWFTLLKSGAAEQFLLREWTESPQLAPAAMAWLAERTSLGEFVRRLPEEVAGRLLENILRAFAVPVGDLVPRMKVSSWANSGDSVQVANGATRDASAHTQSLELVTAPAGEVAASADSPPAVHLHEESRRFEPPAPWLPLVPEASEPRLSILKRILIAQALMLYRAPARARALAFQKVLEEWRQWAEAHPNVAVEKWEAPVEHAAPSAGPERRVGIAASSVPVGETVNPELGATALSEPTSASAVEPSRDIFHFAELPPKFAAVLSDVESDFAGVMFLVNVALYLKLYADFTAPLTTGLELNIWDFVSLLGREIAGEEMENDPMSGLLRALAGRKKPEPPGVHFEPPAEWVIPLSWLDPFPEPFVPTEIVCEGRVQLMHPAGFVISDKPCTPVGPVSLSYWSRWISGYVRARLARALGRDDAAELLCRIAGRITHTSTHVDVHYSLKTYPIEIRVAGLDRDPGWIPSAGRYVAYHFQ